VSRIEAAAVEIDFPLELADSFIGLDEDTFIRIDRVNTDLTPLSRKQSWFS
jgi:hypothetical protein